MAQEGQGQEGKGRGERGGGGGRERRKMRRSGVGRSRVVLLVTAKKLDSQGDAIVPLPRQDANVAAVERGIKDVVFVNVVVAVAWKDLDREQQPVNATQISHW